MSTPVPFWMAFATIAILVASVVVLVFAIVNLVKTIRQNRVTRWSILRMQVYNKRLIESQEAMAREAEALAQRLKEMNDQ